MKGFDTGYCDERGRKFLVGSEVEWRDSKGWSCQGEIIVKDGCMIGADSWEGFVLVKDFGPNYRVIEDKGVLANVSKEVDRKEMKEVIESIGKSISNSSQEWASNQQLAWIYAIIKGWTDEEFKELQSKFRWSDETVKRLNSYYEIIKNITKE